MKYIIAKFESSYGLPIYRVRVRRRFFYSWLRHEDGSILNFPTREEAHDHMVTAAPGAAAAPLFPDGSLRPSL